jgi:hypothetical protein
VPDSDDDVPRWTSQLGIPGLADVHVHFLPPEVLRKVWAFFDRAHDEYGLAWPIEYRDEEADRLATLQRLGVRAFTSLVYAHKPAMAAWLNDWSLDFAGRTPGCVPTATFFAEDGADAYVEAALGRGARVFKVHLQVGGYDPRDPRLRPVWGLLAEAGVPAVVHCGSGPLPGRFTGPGPIGEVMADHPALAVVVAHLGMPETAEFVEVVAAHGRAGLDTTMAGTDFFGGAGAVPAAAVPRLRELARDGRVYLGSDFPNIPYPYAHQLEALVRLGFDDDELRAICWHNPAALLGVDGR